MVKSTYYINSDELMDKYEKLLKVRDDVLKALEVARNEKIIGKSLNAKVTFVPMMKLQNY